MKNQLMWEEFEMKHDFKTPLLLSGISLGVLHTMNRCISAVATVHGLLNKHNGTYYEWRFGNVFYTKSGSGSPLLLLHDASPISSSYEWKELIQKLSADHTVYALDLLGCGRSGKPNLTYTNFLYVQMISDFVKNVIGGKTDVVASGLTGSFVVMACHTNSELFNKIMLINPESPEKLSRVPGHRSKIRKLILDLPIVGTAVYHLLCRRENIAYIFTERYFKNPFKAQKKYMDLYYESAHLSYNGGKYLLSSINGMYLNINIVKALSEINHSIFIVLGESKQDAKAIGAEYTKINPSIEAEFIRSAKQLPQLETPEALYEDMRIFF